MTAIVEKDEVGISVNQLVEKVQRVDEKIATNMELFRRTQTMIRSLEKIIIELNAEKKTYLSLKESLNGKKPS